MHGGCGAQRSSAQLRPLRCPEAAFLSVFNRHARGSAPPESGSSSGARPPGDCDSGERRSSRTYDGAPGLWQCTPTGSRSRLFFHGRATVVALLSVLNRRARGSAPPESAGLAGDQLPCTAPESSAPAAVVHQGGSSFCIQSPCPSHVNVEIVVMSDPTICSSTLVSWSRDTTLHLVIATNSTGTNSILSSRGPSQAKVGEAMNTNSPTDISCQLVFTIDWDLRVSIDLWIVFLGN